MSDERVKPTHGGRERRPYHSPTRARRALATRRRIRAAAECLFVQQGYGPTTTKAIAAAAGVSERTVFLAFATKAALLSELIRVAVRDDDEGDAPLATRPVWTAILAAPSDELLERLADFNAQLMGRAARLLAIGEAAVTIDPALGELRDRGNRAARSQMHDVASELDRRGLLRAGLPVQQAADVLYGLLADEALYLRLTQRCNWSRGEYARLLATLLEGALISPLDPDEPPARAQAS